MGLFVIWWGTLTVSLCENEQNRQKQQYESTFPGWNQKHFQVKVKNKVKVRIERPGLDPCLKSRSRSRSESRSSVWFWVKVMPRSKPRSRLKSSKVGVLVWVKIKDKVKAPVSMSRSMSSSRCVCVCKRHNFAAVPSVSWVLVWVILTPSPG